MEMADAIARVRRDIGDQARTFITNALSDGMSLVFDLPQQKINPIGLVVQFTNGAATVPILPTIVPGTQSADDDFSGTPNFPAWSSSTAYAQGALVSYNGGYYQALQPSTGVQPDTGAVYWQSTITYTLDSTHGVLLLSQPLPLNAAMVVRGQAWGLFTDAELQTIVDDATHQHCQGQLLTERYKGVEGFITYRDTPKRLSNLPKMEENLVVTLADIDALWILATDAATDVNVSTAEGTSIDRSARYEQLMTHIQNLQEKYRMWCGQLGVGMFRPETLHMRRVSYTNNRLVPLFRDREYDDHRYPVRELPQIDRRDEDASGVPSPWWNGLPI